MIVVGVPVDLPGLDRLAMVIDYWSGAGISDMRIDIVFNGQLSPRVPAVLKGVARRSAVPISTTILPIGHLPGRQAQLRAQQLLRDRVLDEGASHLLFHEVYRMPSTSGALAQLLDADAAVAGALYRDPYALGYYCVYEFECEPRESLRYDVLPDPLPDVPASVPGIGFGFTLIRRDALANVPFRSGAHAADSFFSYDARRLGYTIRACPFVIFNSKVDGDSPVLAAWLEARRGQAPLTSPDSPHRFPIDFRARAVREYLQSTESIEAFAARRGVPVAALTRWAAQQAAGR